MTFEVRSPAFVDGGKIPEIHAKEHGNVSPMLKWSGAPEETESYVILVQNPDAPKGTVTHWAVADIPATRPGVDEAQDLSDFTVLKNVFGEASYGGPRPPAGDGPHHYHFRVMALDVPALPIAAGADSEALLQAAEGHILAEAEIVGLYEKQDLPKAQANKGVRLSRFGGADVLAIERADIPQPQDDEVLVRVRAASVNPVDYKIREGKYPAVKESDLPVILGRDLAGTIEAVGTRAHYMLSKGDPVFAFIGQDRGAQSTFVIVKAVELAATPRSLDLVHAAAVPLAAITAWQGLFDHGGLKAGQSVLIHGGAGGVGHFAIQLAKAKGATVYTTCSTDDLDFVCELGADKAIDYKRERFEDVVGDLDMVFDLIAGETQERSFQVLREGGIMVSTLQEPDQKKAAEHRIRTGPRYTAQPNAAQLSEIAALIDAGKIKVIVAETFPLDQVRQAHERLEKGGLRGKIVLTLD